MRTGKFLAPLTLAVGLMSGPAAADVPVPVELAPVNHAEAYLTVVEPDGGEVKYTPADLEELPTYRLVTRTPWREEPAAFEGVLLSDLLARHGLVDVPAIVVTAENDYRVTVPRAVWSEQPVLVATRVDGRPHSRRQRGPIQFVIDEADMLASPAVSENYLVWMARLIEVADG